MKPKLFGSTTTIGKQEMAIRGIFIHYIERRRYFLFVPIVTKRWNLRVDNPYSNLFKIEITR